MAAGLVECAAYQIDLEPLYLVIKVNAARDIEMCRCSLRASEHLKSKFGVAHLRPQAIDRDLLIRRDDNGAFDYIFKLANVARIAVRLEK